MKRISIFYIVFLCAIACVAQTNRLRIPIPVLRTSPFRPTIPTPKPSPKPSPKPKIVKVDTLYACRTAKQHGWFIPVQIISKKDASKRDHVRFTRKNKAGHWCRIEYLTSYGKPNVGLFQPYIVKIYSSTDTLVNQTWKDRLSTGYRIDMISDALGKNVIQERAYDANEELIYSFSVTPYSDNLYVGSYKDYCGLPTEMRQEKGYSYGTLIAIHRDKWGNDSVLQYIDSKGYTRPNSDGAYKEVFVRDKNGNLLKNQSYNANNKLTMDNCGNCGVEYTYDSNNNFISTIYMDDKWHPMKIPSENDVIKTLYEYDKYNRRICERYVDMDNNPMPNRLGTCSQYYEYDNRGNLTKRYAFDKNGNYSPADTTGAALYETVYDNLGRDIEWHVYDSNHNPRQYANYWSSIYSKYNGDRLVEKTCYVPVNGVEQICYHYTDSLETTIYADGSSLIKKYDNNNRPISYTYLKADGSFSIRDDAVTLLQYNIDAEAAGVGHIDKFKDGVNTSCDINNRGDTTRYIINSLDDTYGLYKNFTNGKLSQLNSLETKGKIKKQVSINPFGVPCRSENDVSGIEFYYANTKCIPTGELSIIAGNDEFDESEYIIEDEIIYAYKELSPSHATIFKDEDDNVITDYKSFIDSHPKMASIEVTDSIAYSYGLCDNDIILSYNGMSIDSMCSDALFVKFIDVLNIINTSKQKELVLYHLDPTTLQSSIKKVELGVGAPKDLGFCIHRVVKTRRQVSRIDSTMIANNYSLPEPIRSGDNHMILLHASTDRSYNYNSPYSEKVGKDAILLGAQILEYPGVKWLYNSDFYVFFNLYFFKSKNLDKFDRTPTTRIWFTTNGKDVEYVDIDEIFLKCSFPELNITDNLYKEILPAVNQVPSINYEPITTYSSKDIKKLSTEGKDSIYNLAKLYYLSNFYSSSFPLYKLLADNGYTDAYHEMSLSYLNGWGTTQDSKRAKKYALKCDKLGNKIPIICYAEFCIENGKFKEARKYLESVPKENNYYDKAQLYLGNLEMKRNNNSVAITHYLNALDECFSLDEDDVKQLVHNILTFPDSIDRHMLIYQTACNLTFGSTNEQYQKVGFFMLKAFGNEGYSIGYSSISKAYLYGIGTDKDLKEAENSAKLAHADGYSIGLYNLGEYYYEQREYQQAINILDECANSGSRIFAANYKCGKIYSDKNFFKNKPLTAISYFNKALRQDEYLDIFEEETEDIISLYKTEFADFSETVPGLFNAAIEYNHYNKSEEALSLLNYAYEKFPSECNDILQFGQLKYRLYFTLGMNGGEEYNDFIDTHVATLCVPEDIDKNSPLAELADEEVVIILQLNGWNCTSNSNNKNIFDEVANEGCDIVVISDKGIKSYQNVNIPKSYIQFEAIDRTDKVELFKDLEHSEL
jgi:TPR repeat protein